MRRTALLPLLNDTAEDLRKPIDVEVGDPRLSDPSSATFTGKGTSRTFL